MSFCGRRRGRPVAVRKLSPSEEVGLQSSVLDADAETPREYGPDDQDAKEGKGTQRNDAATLDFDRDSNFVEWNGHSGMIVENNVDAGKETVNRFDGRQRNSPLKTRKDLYKVMHAFQEET